MMKNRIARAALALFVLAVAAAPAAQANPPEVGTPAPAFTGTDTKGVAHSLSDFLGKIVVLEWTNPECPFVKKHYDTGNMQALQKEAVDEGVIWLSIVSSAPGKQGYGTPEEAEKYMAESGSAATARLLDPEGTIGHLYGATSTPNMFVIDAEGNLAYAGAIDDRASPDPASVEGAHNYVRAAIDSLKAGTKLDVPFTRPYGCGIKY